MVAVLPTDADTNGYIGLIRSFGRNACISYGHNFAY